MDNEQLVAVLEYFSDNNINLPEDVKNAIQDVFEENDKIDKVLSYHKEDLETFETDLCLENTIRMYLSGRNAGTVHNVWTYYGSVDFALHENISLFHDNEELVEEVSNYERGEKTLLEYSTEYSVILHEIVSWNTAESDCENRSYELVIYCPEDISEEETEEKKYDKLYEKVKEENTNYVSFNQGGSNAR